MVFGGAIVQAAQVTVGQAGRDHEQQQQRAHKVSHLKPGALPRGC